MSVHDQFLEMMAQMKTLHPQLDLPPQSFIETKGEVLSYSLEGQLIIKFPFDSRFTNPAGVFQGGMLCTLADNVLGPLSYFVAQKLCVTQDLNCRYVRPFTARDQVVVISGKVISKTKQFLILQAEIHNAEKKLIATVTSQSYIVPS